MMPDNLYMAEKPFVIHANGSDGVLVFHNVNGIWTGEAFGDALEDTQVFDNWLTFTRILSSSSGKQYYSGAVTKISPPRSQTVVQLMGIFWETPDKQTSYWWCT